MFLFLSQKKTSQWISHNETPTTQPNLLIFVVDFFDFPAHASTENARKSGEKQQKHFFLFEANKTFPFSPFILSLIFFFCFFLSHTHFSLHLSHSLLFHNETEYRRHRRLASPTLTSQKSSSFHFFKSSNYFNLITDNRGNWWSPPPPRRFLINCEVTKSGRSVRLRLKKAKICVLKGLRLTSDYSNIPPQRFFVFHFSMSDNKRRSERVSAAVVCRSIKRHIPWARAAERVSFSDFVVGLQAVFSLSRRPSDSDVMDLADLRASEQSEGFFQLNEHDDCCHLLWRFSGVFGGKLEWQSVKEKTDFCQKSWIWNGKIV